MATRRIISDEKTIFDKDDMNASSSAPEQKSDISPAVPTNVIVKLLAFSFAMIVGPISVYYLSLNTVFRGNSTLAGATAAVTANVVLIAYVIVAMREDVGDAPSDYSRRADEAKKDL